MSLCKEVLLPLTKCKLGAGDGGEKSMKYRKFLCPLTKWKRGEKSFTFTYEVEVGRRGFYFLHELS